MHSLFPNFCVFNVQYFFKNVIRTEYNSIISQVVTDNNTMVNETAEQTVNKLCWYIINFIISFYFQILVAMEHSCHVPFDTCHVYQFAVRDQQASYRQEWASWVGRKKISMKYTFDLLLFYSWWLAVCSWKMSEFKLQPKPHLF